MDDLDALLRQLAHAPAPAGLAQMEARVLARLNARTVARAGRGLTIGTVAAALVMGIAGGVPASATSASPLAPLGPSSPLAPSSLLAGTP